MRILRSRETSNFVYLLVQCSCGRRFGHREDRRTVVCFHCGRVMDLGRIRLSDEARKRLLARRRRLRRIRLTQDTRPAARRSHPRAG